MKRLTDSHCTLVSCRPPISVSPASWRPALDEAWQSRHQVCQQVHKQVSLAAAAASLAVHPSGPVVGERTKMEPSETQKQECISWTNFHFMISVQTLNENWKFSTNPQTQTIFTFLRRFDYLNSGTPETFIWKTTSLGI